MGVSGVPRGSFRCSVMVHLAQTNRLRLRRRYDVEYRERMLERSRKYRVEHKFEIEMRNYFAKKVQLLRLNYKCRKCKRSCSTETRYCRPCLLKFPAKVRSLLKSEGQRALLREFGVR